MDAKEVISSSLPDRNLLMRYAGTKVVYKIGDRANLKTQRWQDISSGRSRSLPSVAARLLDYVP